MKPQPKTEVYLPPGCVTVADAARLLELEPGTIRKYFDRGLLKRTNVGRAVFVRRAEVTRFAAKRRKYRRS